MRLRLPAGIAWSKNFQKTRFIFFLHTVHQSKRWRYRECHVDHEKQLLELFARVSQAQRQMAVRRGTQRHARCGGQPWPGTRRHTGGTLLFCATCLQASQTQQQKLTPPCGVGYKERKISPAILTMQLCNCWCWFQVHMQVHRLKENCLPGQCLGY